MSEVARRPFYSEYAWAFDLLIDRPVRKECAVIAAWLIDRGITPGAEVLDAGCGTGRYAIELARRGYVVHGLDQSPELIEVATRARAGSPGRVSFTVGDIARLPASRYSAILCRGVLNDIIDDAGRDTVFAAFAEASATLDIGLGAFNTAVLIASSLTMAMAVWSAQMSKKKLLVFFLLATFVLGGVFLGVKVVEYSHKFHEHHVPGRHFTWDDPATAPGAQMFFSLYFAMTGLHASHMVVGMALILFLLVPAARGRFSRDWYNPIECFGL